MKEPKSLLGFIAVTPFTAREKRKKTKFRLLPIIFLWLGSSCGATAQDASVEQSAQIRGDEQQIIQDDDNSIGKYNRWRSTHLPRPK
jgi:hypothetical protein